jgi:hypothetical protein
MSEIIEVIISQDGPQGEGFCVQADTYAEAEAMAVPKGQIIYIGADETQYNSPETVYIYNGTTLKLLQILS